MSAHTKLKYPEDFKQLPVEVCRLGHVRTPNNTYYRPNGTRTCRVCKLLNERLQEQRRKERIANDIRRVRQIPTRATGTSSQDEGHKGEGVRQQHFPFC